MLDAHEWERGVDPVNLVLRWRSLAVARGLHCPESARLARIGSWEPHELNNGILGFAVEHKGFAVFDKDLVARAQGLLLLVKDKDAAAREDDEERFTVLACKQRGRGLLRDGKHLKA